MFVQTTSTGTSVPCLKTAPQTPGLASPATGDNPPDPLSNNYIVAPECSLFVTYRPVGDAGDQIHLQQLTPEQAVDKSWSLGNGNCVTLPIEADQGWQVSHQASIAGNFTDPLKTSAAVAYSRWTNNLLELHISMQGPQANGETLDLVEKCCITVAKGIQFANPVEREKWRVRLCSARLYPNQAGSNLESLVVLYPDGQGNMNMAIFSFDENYDYTKELVEGTFPFIGIAQDNPVEVAAGDLDGDGLDELAVTWGNTTANISVNTLNISVLKYNRQFAQMSVLTTCTAGSFDRISVSAAMGRLRSGAQSEDLVIAYTDYENETTSLSVYMLGKSDYSLSLLAATQYPDGIPYAPVYPGYARVAVGDVLFAGQAQIILGTLSQVDGANQAIVLCGYHLDIPSTDNTQYVLTRFDTGFINATAPLVEVANRGFDMKIGALSANLLNCLYVATTGIATAADSSPIGDLSPLMAGAVQFTNGGFPKTMKQITGQLPNPLITHSTVEISDFYDTPISIMLGDFTGDTLSVGAPTYTRLDTVNHVIAVINAPPTFQTADYSTLGFATAALQISGQNTLSLSLTVSRAWTMSDSIKADVNFSLSAALTTVYGEHFSKTDNHQKTFQYQLTFEAQYDDVILLSVTSFDVWEYPVYKNGQREGHLLVVFPDITGQAMPAIGTFEGKDLNWGYFPRHEVGNLLSYLAEKDIDIPTDPEDVISDGNTYAIGSTAFNQTIDWSETDSHTTTKESSLSTTVSAEGGLSETCDFLDGAFLGISCDLQGTYTKETTNTHEITVTDGTTVSLVYTALTPPPPSSYAYYIHPLIYWSANGGYLKLDYYVTFDQNTFWTKNFQTPNPDFCKFWRDETDASRHDCTRSIQFLKQDDEVLITVKVRNYALVQSTGNSIQLYLGDPAAGGVAISSNVKLDTIPARGQCAASIENWTPPADIDSSTKIYCQILDSNNKVLCTGFNYYYLADQSKVQSAK